MTLQINDVVKVKELKLNKTGVKQGNIGTIIEVFQESFQGYVLSSYEVEFINGQGKLIDILTLTSNQVQKVK